ncbi:MAG TPA: hypothetical protein PLL02_02560 [Bacteroidales bacterium]|jgi:hypothetical protein|nr:hypothetical protein [Bacteroidales bacterium]
MKKSILTLAVLAFLFTSCEKPEEEVKLTFSGDIMIELGSSDEDVLAFVSASDGSAVTVSGIDYNKAGEQTATFKAGNTTETKQVKVKANELAGRYNIAVFSSDGSEMTQGDGWAMKILEGDNYNQIKISSTIETGDKTIFTHTEYLVVTFNGKDEPKIDTYNGGILFQTTPPTAEWEFSEIEYGLNETGKYSMKGFRMDGYAPGYEDFYFTVEFTKRR